jgi:S1-C subfamily serine protease
VINLSPAAALEQGVDPFSGSGVVVSKVEGGFAQSMGLQPGDFIRAINGRAITSTADVTAAVAAPGSGWRLTIERGGRTISAQFSG